MKKLVVLFVGLFVIAITAQAQNNATATAQTSATIITPLSIEKNVDLAFGNIVRSSTAGTVVIATTGDRSFTGGLSAFGSLHGNPTAAQFSVSGETDANYSIQLPTADVILTLEGGGATMIIAHESFNHNAGTTPKISGDKSFKVGATLSLEAEQAAGTYNGTFDVKIAYE